MSLFLKVSRKSFFSKIKEKLQIFMKNSPMSWIEKQELNIQRNVNSLKKDELTNGYKVTKPSSEHKIIAFNNYRGISKIDVKTDADLIGGETTYEIRYNMADESIIIEGNFEMKRKDLIQNTIMFVRIQFDIIRKNYHFNLIKVRAKTNGHFLKLQFGLCYNYFETILFAGHIVDKSKEFETYELHFKNFKCMIDRESDDYLNSPLGNLEAKLNTIVLEIESKEEGPYSVELHSIELCYDEKYDEIYDKYLIPIFKKV